MDPNVDLLSLVLTLRPLEKTNSDRPLPRWWGRAAQALMLGTIQEYNAELAETLHSDHEIRAFTTSTLMGRFPGWAFDRDQPYTLRLTAMENEVAGILLQAAKDGPLATSSTVELDYFPFKIETSYWNPEEHPWAAVTTYQDLSASRLLTEERVPKRLEMQFTSPTTFKSGGMHIPIPLPELVFGSLLERWNAIAPLAFPEEAKRYAAECLAISRYKLSTRAVPLKGGGLRVGAVGKISYISLNYDRYWMSVMATLAEFALFSGAGAGTAMGLGQCKKM